MSADRRKQILIGFGALAVVLVAVIAIVRPTFRSEEATGAIGAVQKHHAPQIAKQDVILGGEQVKQDQKVLFADYLADAKQLKSFSFGSAAARAESFAQLSQKEQQLGVRFNEDLTYALGVAKQLANDEALSAGSRERAMGIIAILIGQRATDAAQMSDLAMKLNSVAEALGSAKVDMAHLEVANLASAEQSLGAISRAENYARLQAEADYLGMIAKESAVLQAASLQSAANLSESDAMALGSRFTGMAASLEQRAQANARAELTLASDEAAALGRMSDLLSRMESTANVADAAQLESVRNNLNARFEGVRANYEAVSSLASDTEFAAMLGSDDSFNMQVKALSDEVQDLGSRVRLVRRGTDPNREPHPIRERGPRKR